MDRPFIKLMCESFYSDFELKKSHIWPSKEEAVSDLTADIFKVVENLKLEDFKLYESLFEFGRQKQYNIIYNLLFEYIEETFSEEVTEVLSIPDNLMSSEIMEDASMIALAILAGAGAGAVHAFSKPMHKAKIAVFTKLNEITQKIAKTINDKTAKYRVTKAVLYSNFDNCLQKCGINSLKDLDVGAVRFQTYGIGKTPKGEEQSSCLIECYINGHKELIAELARAYRECLMTNGQRVTNLNFSEIIGSCPVSGCQVFYKQITSHRKAFEEASKILAGNDAAKANKFMVDYDKALTLGLQGKRTNFGQ